MRDYHLLIFDWDGTLCDSIDRIVLAMHRAAQQCELPPCTDEQVRNIIGLALPEAVRVLWPQLDEHQVEVTRSAYGEHYVQLDQQPSPLYDGVVETLHGFKQQGYRLAVATGKRRRGLQRALAGCDWLEFFDQTRCADETASKPDPLMLHEILAALKVAPEQALMVGDASFDLLMAQRAGMDSVAVSYGAQSVADLQACSPKLVIDHIAQLADWLAQVQRKFN
ncbi:HAD-IA family hydrolase [Pseudomonas sp. 5P_3.1_Bac2]|uniref:HAD-IA family hydrolase n=1 Tax=Pseudomonas sp. 5P_3.1_Bac2 TaxID=2971617 RepID=UPI0021C7E1A1|nr:HAD-IA family hydrolase [Pseudomonas sp. 5P_3.1_Bac2]MCU1716616.1 HAD-IA family hydrolase [Pseudomonas sp. 5P_3.1_Bac2]